MCLSNPKPATPPPPPPPPPVLEQAAPDVAAPTAAEEARNRALGSKQYRNTSLTIGNVGQTRSAATNSGLSIMS